MVTYMVSLWKCISYLVAFGTIIHGLKIFITLLLQYFFDAEGLFSRPPGNYPLTEAGCLTTT